LDPIVRCSIGGLSAHSLTVFNAAKEVYAFPIGVGKATTPTPNGRYYIKELLKPPNPNGDYGPFAYGLSGFSDAVPNYNGGSGVLGIHGTNEPDKVGTDVSHGCIRLRNADIERLAAILPLGTPVIVQA
jgi:lipoprotein-anchoring transpeptidase ErfK/SrfK